MHRKPRLLSSGKHDAVFYQTLFAAVAKHGYWRHLQHPQGLSAASMLERYAGANTSADYPMRRLIN